MSQHRVVRSVSIALVIIACADNTAPETGTVRGTVKVEDEWGRLLTRVNVAVSVNGGPEIGAMSGVNGQWELTDLPAGTADIHFAHLDAAPLRIPGQSVVAGEVTVASDQTLATAATHTAIIDSTRVGLLGADQVVFVDGHLTVTPPSNAVWSTALLLTSTSATVSVDPATYRNFHAAFASGSQTTFTIPLSVQGLRADFGAGTTIYLAPYGTSAACSCYDDAATGRRIFTAVGPKGPVISVVVP